MKADDTLKQLSQNIRKFRELKGYTREEFCAKLGLEPSYWGTIERGERYINLPRLLQVCEVFETDISQFMPTESAEPATAAELAELKKLIAGLNKKQLDIVKKFIYDVALYI